MKDPPDTLTTAKDIQDSLPSRADSDPDKPSCKKSSERWWKGPHSKREGRDVKMPKKNGQHRAEWKYGTGEEW